MENIKKIEMFESFDGKLFRNYEDAVKHTVLSNKVNLILSLLGNNSDVMLNKVANNFSDGGGKLLIDINDFSKAMSLFSEIQEERSLSQYSKESIRIYEDDYLGNISFILKSIFKDLQTGEIFRVGQPYFVSHQDKLDDKIYR